MAEAFRIGENEMNANAFGIGASVTLARTISESDVYLFGGITGDLGRNHIDAEYARTHTFYKRRVVHGALMVGLASAASTLMGDRYDKGKWRGASYGYDRVRFIRPVFIGDTITVTYTIKSLDEQELKTYADVVATNQRGETCFAAIHIAKGLPTIPASGSTAVKNASAAKKRSRAPTRARA
jgi:acyl dehydratase